MSWNGRGNRNVFRKYLPLPYDKKEELMKHSRMFNQKVGLTTLQFMRCRCAKCKSRNKSGLTWERHPDGVWRKRNTTQRETNE